jgi:hypothetical protein
MYEALRLFPIACHSNGHFSLSEQSYAQVPAIPKIAAEDTQLTVGNADDEVSTFPIPKGTTVMIHTTGLHYNRLSGLCSSPRTNHSYSSILGQP